MKKVIATEKRPIKMWLDDIEDGALEQAKSIANLPFTFKHVAIMPDSHQGYGMPIGGVLATKNVVIPNAVGVDIGCGMCAVKTSLKEIDTETIKRIFGGSKEYQGGIRSLVPVGKNKHSKKQDEALLLEHNSKIVDQEFSNALKSLGTLGGGNHFIEIQKGDDGHIWIMIHSGSRNPGLKVAEYYNLLAYNLNKKWHSNTYLPKNPKESLAFLPLDSEEGQDYLEEMNYCVEFAFTNRKLMMDRVKESFINAHHSEVIIEFDEMINIAHNYARMENHFGENVMVHRKGATSAKEGEIGIIPGSQGTKSYITRGLGNKDSFNSCSHGAGRVMGRRQAQKNLDLESEVKSLEDKGILHSIRGKKDLDEAPSCYKDIDAVMENQKDLTEIVVELTPLAVIKG